MVILGQQATGTYRPILVNTDGAIKVYDIAAGTVSVGSITSITNTVAVYFDRGNPGVQITSGTVTGITNSIAVVLFTPAGSQMGDEKYDALRVVIGAADPTVSLVVSGQQVAGTNRPLIVNTDGAIKIYDLVTGTVGIAAGTNNIGDVDVLSIAAGDNNIGNVDIASIAAGDNNIGNVDIVSGTVTGITNSIAVHILSTNGTMAVFSQVLGTVSIKAADGTMAVYFSPNAPTVKKEKASTGSFNKIAVVTTARQVVASNAARISVSLVHDSANTMYIGLANTVGSAYTGTGFPLLANQIFVIDDYTGAIFAVHETGESNIKFIEI